MRISLASKVSVGTHAKYFLALTPSLSFSFVLEESKDPALVDKEDSDSYRSDARSNDSDDV